MKYNKGPIEMQTPVKGKVNPQAKISLESID